jgi:hypothetical protein
MRKHKSVVAILLAVMMIFTFMPAMVFAANYSFTVKSWDDSATGKYGSVVGKCTDTTQADQTFETKRGFSSDTDTNPGLITAVPQNKTDGVVGGNTYTAPASSAYFYDFDGAKLVYLDGGKYKELNGASFTQSTMIGRTIYVEFVEPDYSSDAVAAKEAGTTYTAKKAHFALTTHSDYDSDLNAHTATYTGTFGGWTLTIKRDPIYYDSEGAVPAKKEQSVKFTVDSFVPSGAIDPTVAADKFGTLSDATIKVVANAVTPADAKFYLDEVGTGLKSVVYDGNEHTVVADTVAGYQISYEVLNPTTGKYEAKTAVTITDVQKNDVTFRAVFKDAKGTETKGAPQSLNLLPLGTTADAGRAVYFGFGMKESEADSSAVYTVPATEYDALNYVAFVAQEKAITGATTEAQAAVKKANDGAKSAVEKNAENLKNWFNDYYTIKDVTTKAQAKNNEVHVQINSKAGSYTKAEMEALDKKYDSLTRNFGGNIATPPTTLINNDFVKSTATIKLNGAASKDYEVAFTNAPTSKVYKGKKTTKAGKLKKNQSFTVTAVANDGKTVAYKLVNANIPKISIDSTTGKITIKKGAKGTYKIKVKAYVPGNSVVASETQAITIKIKK